jgi:release factor glutamine methyltransferase
VTTVVDVLKRTEAFFRDMGIESPRLDAELILSHHLGLDRVGLYLQFDRPLVEADLAPMRDHVRRRGQREPMAWIRGTQSFWKLDLAVHSGVLVPRPDTETLVETALALIPETGECFVADIGCGSGAVGLAIASERPDVRLFATDIDPAALNCTKENVQRLGLGDRVAVLRGSLLDPIPADRPIDIIVSNPPYIASGEIDGLAPEIAQHEPRTALDGGADGLDVYRSLIPIAVQRARQAVVVEIGAAQGPAVQREMTQSGIDSVRIVTDLGGRDRVVEGRFSG